MLHDKKGKKKLNSLNDKINRIWFDFNNKKYPCLRCFYQEETISDDILNCEYEGILGTIAGIIGTMQANEILKKILNCSFKETIFVILSYPGRHPRYSILFLCLNLIIPKLLL